MAIVKGGRWWVCVPIADSARHSRRTCCCRFVSESPATIETSISTLSTQCSPSCCLLPHFLGATYFAPRLRIHLPHFTHDGGCSATISHSKE